MNSKLIIAEFSKKGKIMKVFKSLIALCVIGSVVFASPTIYGPSGLISIPTAEALKYKEMNIALDYYQDSEENTSQYYKLNLGTFENWEIGFVGGQTPTEGVYINAKYYLMSDKSRYPLSIAIGVDNIASQEKTGMYMVASKVFKGGLVGHFGFKTMFDHEEGIDPSIMGGTEFFFSDQFSILADINGEKKTYIVNAGLRFELMDNFHIRGFVMDVTKNREEQYFSLGISYSQFL